MTSAIAPMNYFASMDADAMFYQTVYRAGNPSIEIFNVGDRINRQRKIRTG
jgi:hypothetical protein